MFRPFKGEVLDAVVTQVNKVKLLYFNFSSALHPLQRLSCRRVSFTVNATHS